MCPTIVTLVFCHAVVFLSAVDEYIAIAKEKHGYNVEQVDIVN